MKTARQWLDGFTQAINKTQCHREGSTLSLDEGMSEMMRLLEDTRRNGGTVWWVANGGSSSIGSHLSQDLINKLKIRSQTLTDACLITCMANDFGYENVYSKPLEVLLREGDMLIGISSSGNSKNILNCVELAAAKKVKSVALSSFKEDNALWKQKASLSFYLPSDLYGHAEAGHLVLLHAIIETMVLNEILGT